MNFYKQYIRKHWFGICVFSILIIAAILRFYNYENRWGLAYDQARDVLVAREALAEHKIPLIGPFASAGQFIYGPWWFWILMVMVSVYPYSVITPWLIQTFLYVVVVWLMIIIGKDIYNKRLGLVLGVLTAISTTQLAQSTNLTSPSMVGIFSVVSIYFFIRYIKTGFIKNAFWMAFMIATSVNIHFQAFGLLVLVAMVIILKKNSFRKIAFLIIGIFIPFIPLIIFDLTNNFFESRNWIEYIRYGQYAIYIPNRWFTYAGVYWPNSWAKIIGGEVYVAYMVLICLAILTAYEAIKRKLTRSMTGLILGFLSTFFMLRYYRGERIDSNLAFLHPFVLILAGWVIIKILKLNRVVGSILFLVVLVFTLRVDLSQIKNGENFTAIQASEWKNTLVQKLPDKKFSVYDYQYGNANKSLPLVLFLYSGNKTDDKGVKIGLYIATSKTNFKYPSVIGDRGNYQIINLNSTTSAHLAQEKWVFVNPSEVYRSTVEWYKYKKL